jgi:hypothetical protein
MRPASAAAAMSNTTNVLQQNYTERKLILSLLHPQSSLLPHLKVNPVFASQTFFKALERLMIWHIKFIDARLVSNRNN